MIISGFGWLCLVPGRIKSSFHWAAYWGENRGHSHPLSPAASFPIVHGYWMFPKEKNVASQAIYKTILIYALSLKSVWNHPRLHAQVLAAFLPVTGAMESPPRYSKGNRCTSSSAQAPSLCNHQLLGQSLLNSKADQRLCSLCLVCFLSPSSFSWCWCKLGAGLLKEMKLLEKRTGGKKNNKKHCAKFSRRLFLLCFFCREELGHLQNNCTEPSIFPLLSFSIWKGNWAIMRTTA